MLTSRIASMSCAASRRIVRAVISAGLRLRVYSAMRALTPPWRRRGVAGLRQVRMPPALPVASRGWRNATGSLGLRHRPWVRGARLIGAQHLDPPDDPRERLQA